MHKTGFRSPRDSKKGMTMNGREALPAKGSKALLLTLLLGVGLSSEALALPFKFDVGLTGKNKGTLELVSAKDENVLSKIALGKGRFYTLDFPAEGLYTVRIKNQDKVIWKETVYILTENPAQDVLMRTSWALRAGTMRTVIRVQDPQGDLRFGVSIRDKIFLRLRGVPRLVRVFQEDYSGGVLAAADLKISKVTEKQAKDEVVDSEPDIQLDPNGPEDDQSAFEPDYKGLLAGKEDKTWRQKVLDLSVSRKLEPLNRPHRVYAWLRIMQESFAVRRDPDSYNGEKTQGFGTGIGANAVFKDTMSLQLEIDTHGTKTQYEKGGANPPADEQKRIHARFGPLFDVLNVEHNHPRWALEIGPVIGYTQIPLEKDNEGKSDFGGSIRGQYFGASHGEAQIRFMKSHSRDISLLWVGSAYKISRFSPLFGLYNYHTEFETSEAKAEFDETGVRFGIHAEF